jgi:hypothetical protein
VDENRHHLPRRALGDLRRKQGVRFTGEAPKGSSAPRRVSWGEMAGLGGNWTYEPDFCAELSDCFGNTGSAVACFGQKPHETRL